MCYTMHCYVIIAQAKAYLLYLDIIESFKLNLNLIEVDLELNIFCIQMIKYIIECKLCVYVCE